MLPKVAYWESICRDTHGAGVALVGSNVLPLPSLSCGICTDLHERCLALREEQQRAERSLGEVSAPNREDALLAVAKARRRRGETEKRLRAHVTQNCPRPGLGASLRAETPPPEPCDRIARDLQLDGHTYHLVVAVSASPGAMVEGMLVEDEVTVFTIQASEEIADIVKRNLLVEAYRRCGRDFEESAGLGDWIPDDEDAAF